MSLWRLEWLRMIRTYRIIVLPALFVLAGFLGPALAKILPELVSEVGGGIEIILPEPTAYEGIVQYLGNVDQLGLVGIAVFAAMSMTFDSKREIAAFLRSRADIPAILAPRFATSFALSAVSILLGAAVALLLTDLLLGTPPTTEVMTGAVLYIVYAGFIIAMVTLIAAMTRSALVVVIVAIVGIIISGVMSLIPVVGDWLPSRLPGATVELMNGGTFAFWPSIGVTVAVTAALLTLAIYLFDRRET